MVWNHENIAICSHASMKEWTTYWVLFLPHWNHFDQVVLAYLGENVSKVLKNSEELRTPRLTGLICLYYSLYFLSPSILTSNCFVVTGMCTIHHLTRLFLLRSATVSCSKWQYPCKKFSSYNLLQSYSRLLQVLHCLARPLEISWVSNKLCSN